MRRILSIFVAVSFLLFPLSCAREEVDTVGIADGGPVEFSLPFGAGSLENVLVTKSTLEEQSESAIYNLYVFLFDAEGNKFYGKFFDGSNLGSKPAHSSDWWTISNQSSSVAATSGTIHIRSLARGEGCKIVVIANIDAEMLSMSADQLKTVSKWSDLQNVKVKLNQVMVSRSGHFPMTGVLEDVSITRVPGTTNSIIKVGDSDAAISLQRLDAKIIFNVRVAAGEGVNISSFSPMTWKVVNAPKSCYLVERGHYGTTGPFTDAGTSINDYFETTAANFESETPTSDTYAATDQHHISIHSFSFYMLESRLSPKATPSGGWTYADRERQEKISLSATRVKNGAFLYAPDLAPYVEFSGRLQMSGAADASTLSASVQYRIHLGDFGADLANFSVFRNHTYVYDIIIHGVDDIRAEVEGIYDEDGNLVSGPEEREPGASGEVSVSRETVLVSDAHYSTHVITFHAANIDADRVTWDVVTPFNPKGATPSFTPEGNEVTAGIDYEWVEFRLNNKDSDGKYYQEQRQIYKPRSGNNIDPENPTMTVSDLVAYLKEQKAKFDAGEPSDFDTDENPKIAVTAFVNEYYYETHPLTGQYDPQLWKKVVNQPMRYMHILSETKTSADGESRVVGASFTIEQKSIQSIYNVTTEGLNSAWGSEHTDDEQNLGIAGRYWSNQNNEERGNTSLSNGKENTLKEWNLIDAKGNVTSLGQLGNSDAWWSTYLQLEASNETPYMKEGYRYLRYSCLSRNRDNDGDGVIDADEVRWYMAAENQLMGLFFGSYGIEGDARLYQRSAEQMASKNKDDWRQHVVASTVNAHGTGSYAGKNSNKFARVIWAEEGTSGSSLAYTGNNDQTSKFSVRCVRNLGHDPATGNSITYSSFEVEPDPVIVTHRMKNGQEFSGAMDDGVYYVFDCTRLNKASLRYYTSSELVSHHEFSEQACLYAKFESASRNASIMRPDEWTARGITEWLDSDANKGKANQFCPEGYRMCNLREMLLLRYFIPSGDVGYYFNGQRNLARTWWFFGAHQPISNYRKTNDHWGFANSAEKTEKAGNSQKTKSIRCVRDIKD